MSKRIKRCFGEKCSLKRIDWYVSVCWRVHPTESFQILLKKLAIHMFLYNFDQNTIICRDPKDVRRIELVEIYRLKYIFDFVVLMHHQLVRWTEGVQISPSVKRKRR